MHNHARKKSMHVPSSNSRLYLSDDQSATARPLRTEQHNNIQINRMFSPARCTTECKPETGCTWSDMFEYSPGLPSIVSGGGLRSYLLISIGAGAPYTSHDSTDAATLNLLSSTWCSSMPSATGPGLLPTAPPPATGLGAAVCSPVSGLWGSVPVKAPGLLGDALDPCPGLCPAALLGVCALGLCIWSSLSALACSAGAYPVRPIPGRAGCKPTVSVSSALHVHTPNFLPNAGGSVNCCRSFFGSTDSISKIKLCLLAQNVYGLVRHMEITYKIKARQQGNNNGM